MKPVAASEWVGLAELLKAKREALGLSQDEVAAYVGVSGPTLGRFEKGLSMPKVPKLSLWMRRLGFRLVMLEPGDWHWHEGACRPLKDVTS